MNKNKQQPQCVNMFTMPAAATRCCEVWREPRCAPCRRSLPSPQTPRPTPPSSPLLNWYVSVVILTGVSRNAKTRLSVAHTGDTIRVACAAKPPKTMFWTRTNTSWPHLNTWTTLRDFVLEQRLDAWENTKKTLSLVVNVRILYRCRKKLADSGGLDLLMAS